MSAIAGKVDVAIEIPFLRMVRCCVEMWASDATSVRSLICEEVRARSLVPSHQRAGNGSCARHVAPPLGPKQRPKGRGRHRTGARAPGLERALPETALGGRLVGGGG